MLEGTYRPDDLAGSSFTEPRGHGHSRLARLAIVVVLGLTLMAGFGIAAPDVANAGLGGTINTNGVEVFAHLTDLTVIDHLDSGDRVDIFWGPEDFMYEVHYNGTIGWVWAEFLDPDGSGASGANSSSDSATTDMPPAPAPSSAANQAGAWSWSAWAMVDADSLNVRSDASSSAGVVDSYGPGEWIEVIGNDFNGYSPINYFGDVAWVATAYLSWDGEFNYATVSTGATSNAAVEVSAPTGERWIDVNARSGQVTLYVGATAQATYWGSVGFDNSLDGFYSTAVGTYYVYAKWEPLAYTKWAGAYITHWVGFDPSRFNGFHSYSKDANGSILPNGTGKTGGCVALAPAEIQAVFDFSYIGMRVEVHR